MRLVPLVFLGALLEVGWLALWPLAGALSHSALFNAAFLEAHPLARQLFEAALNAAHALMPSLPDQPLSDPLGARAYFRPAAALALVMVGLAGAYLGAVMLLARGLGRARAAVWVVLGGGVVFQVTLLYLPGLFSQDVFSYIAYGRLASVYDLNPYVWPPSAIVQDSVLPWVAEIWRTYPSPYGPLWVDVQWALGSLLQRASVADQAMAYRVLANAVLLANLGLVWRLLGRLTPMDRGRRTTALAALAWNPAILFEVAGNAHNDGLMVSLSLLALLVYARSNNAVVAGATFSLGALVKYLSGLGLVWVALAAAGRAASGKTRLRQVALIALVSGAIVLGVAAPWLELPDSLQPIVAETAGVGFVNSLPDSLARAVADQVASLAGVSAVNARDTLRGFERLVVMLGFGAYLVWEARRVWLDASAAAVARALARSSLIYILVVSTSVQTWYFCLPVSIAVVLGWRSLLTRLTIGYSLLALPALYLSYYLREATPGWVNLVYGLGPWVACAPALWSRARHSRTRVRSRAAADRVRGTVVVDAR